MIKKFSVKKTIYIFGVLIFITGVILYYVFPERPQHHQKNNVVSSQEPKIIKFLAVGDINLGRTVGQRILNEDINYPFHHTDTIFRNADIVFANLECQLSDQKGKTQHSKNNLIFTGPPQGATSLSNAGIWYVSTANNHAFDYGKKALLETLENLDSQNIVHVGTHRSEKYLYEPICFEENGIRFALFAVTDVMNFKNGWEENVAQADTGKLFPIIREARNFVDIIIVSFHGGNEYQDTPTQRVKDFAYECAKQKVDIFLGHHPHVPYGIEKYHNMYIFHSLGNFVFYQPQHFWTQVSYAAEITIQKNDTVTSLKNINIIPIKADYQPQILQDSIAKIKLEKQVRKLSNIF